jgi:acetate kinase
MVAWARTNEVGGDRSVLALNRGSSTLKFGLFTLSLDAAPLFRGTVAISDDRSAFEQVIARVSEPVEKHPLAVVAHRLVHGGPNMRAPRTVDDALLVRLQKVVQLAPNHLPDEIALIEDVRRARPDLTQIVCFDTAFHADLPDVARRLPIPAEYAAEGIQRYGFHGLSYTFLIDELRRGPTWPVDRAILAHLGNGSSLAAVRHGYSVDTTMGFTPIGGVVMGTRSGDLDPGVVTYIARSHGLDPDQVERELSHRSGLAGISAGTSDMRELLAREQSDEECRLAVAIYCYEIKKRIGAYAAALGGLDVLVFSGGIGEHAPVVRSRICSGLEFLGIDLDPAANIENAAVISTSQSRVAVHVIPTDEEVVLARAAHDVLVGPPRSAPRLGMRLRDSGFGHW